MFDLESALYDPAWHELNPAMEVQLDRIRKKIEVPRKLYRLYLADLSRPATSTLLSSAAVQRLSVLLLKAALIWHDARYLNSALKLVDGVLERDDCVFREDVRALAISTLNAMVPPTPSLA
ncbi:hypothetical protein [Rhodoferax sp. TH121]|uniref:hypothetical protein n=1 Tax=Rhodoferax sp. TH121 TaxID=2022803 RepID=UPI0011405A7C|nr:hypothetical protein [Rhodoferax sp. TH121]